ncbi:AfsR/SARP family transcriptional regulator [Tenggerimyces flavus]|uniref:BTAD domain-containing putative transcriptional regulator n=1 Tax=Tenggerimyces flavus TaxID=1708749 RepID=A0ABV7Y9D0_9ACTN|nr:BTAD domain-containing putative transcriptional regulator [Tenggerimyces flavus]MBM7785036.1 DNA-binding SARP family transcriptional activator [Tenggerimyces flavus]
MPRLTVGVLGQLEVSVDGRPVRLTTGRLRALLAVLAMSAGQTVSMQRLTAAVWGDDPPHNPKRSLQTYATRLRAELGAQLISGHSGGLVLDAAADQVDALRFEQLLDDASPRATPAEERQRLDEALGLWRGEPFEGVESRWLDETLAPRLSELRLSALERRIDLDLAAGRHGELVGELNEWTVRCPLRESLWARLLVVLDRCGRRADALERYHHIRLRIADELGVDPSQELQQVYADLLADQPAVAEPVPASLGVPQQLPAPPPVFVGRTAELTQLDADDDSPTVVITAIDGMAGVGKTTLAVHLAHQLAERYPDGQLFLDLHGFTEGIEPVDPSDALDRLLRSLGVPGEQIPPQLDARAALFRSHLADQRVLLLLDNAATEAQVAPLIPGSAHCLVLITSRRRLAALDQTRTVSLDVLPPADALGLFTTTAGPERLAGEPPELLRELVELCGRLPLALRIAAARLRMHRTWTARHLLDLLADRQRRLDELDLGRRSVIGALDLSYHQLTPRHQHAYRLIGLHPGPDLDLHAATALLDEGDTQSTRRLLEELLSAHLMQEPTPDRYRFHDLTRQHAAAIAGADEPAATRRSALEGLFASYLHTAAVAMDVGYPFEYERRPHPAPGDHPVPSFQTAEQATTWLDLELPNLLAVARYTAENGWLDHPPRLAALLERHLMSRGRTTDAERLDQLALDTARAAGDAVAEVDAVVRLAHLHRLAGQYPQAEPLYQRALTSARESAYRRGEADALHGLGQMQRLQGQFAEASDSFGRALDLAELAEYPTGALEAQLGLGHLYNGRGQHELAAKHLTRSLALARDTGHRFGELDALFGLGWTHLAQDDARAADDFAGALKIARADGYRIAELASLTGLGGVHLKHGRFEEAAGCYEDVLSSARQLGKPNWTFEALQGLGRARLSQDRPDDALACHQEALDIANQIGQQVDAARAHDGIAHAHRARQEHDQARRHWQLALRTFAELGIESTSEDWMASVTAIRGHLATYED